MPFCRECGKEIPDDAKFCPHCRTAVVSTASATPADDVGRNTSGQGKLAVVPPEIKGWNWGAFFLTWIWGIRNRTYIAFLSLIPFVSFVMPFILGANGSHWSWRNQKWDSIEQFKKSQRRWAIWGLIIFVVVLSIAIGVGIWSYFFPFLYL
jgi:hypothetical protein